MPACLLLLAATGSLRAMAYTIEDCGALLEGKVVDRAGSPVAGATINVAGDLSSPDRTRPWTGADGSFKLDQGVIRTKCPSPTSLTVAVSAKGFLPKSETRTEAADGWFHFDFVLDRVVP